MSVGISRKRRMEKCHETRKSREVKVKRQGPTFWLPCHRSCGGGDGGGGGGGMLVVVVMVHKSRHVLAVNLI
jgi:hypothetical protein